MAAKGSTARTPSKPEVSKMVQQHDQEVEILRQQNGKSFLMKLSTEIRFMILDYFVPRDSFVEICSLMRRPCRYSSAPWSSDTEDFMTLRLVNKQICRETCKLFYSRNWFTIGNGSYGSTESINIHGVKRFLATIPAENLAQIRMLGIGLSLRQKPFIICPITEGIVLDGDGFRYLARVLNKRFTGVTNLFLYLPDHEDRSGQEVMERWYNNHEDKWSLFLQHQKWPAFIQTILKHEKLEKIDVGITVDNDKVEKSIRSFMENSEAAGRIVVTQNLRPTRRGLWEMETKTVGW